MTLRWRGGPVHADGAIWVIRFNNYIYGALTGRTCDEEGNCAIGNGEDLKQLFYAQQDALFRGAEAHAEIELLRMPPETCIWTCWPTPCMPRCPMTGVPCHAFLPTILAPAFPGTASASMPACS